LGEHSKRGKKAIAVEPAAERPEVAERAAVAPDSRKPTDGTVHYPAAGDQTSRAAPASERTPDVTPQPKREPVTASARTPDAPPEKKPEPTTYAASNLPTRIAATDPTPEPAIPATKPNPSSPLGVWLTENGEGKIRVEECGRALCGFSVPKNVQVLFGMKPTQKSRWEGKIYHPKNGNTYAGHISLRNPNTLRVEGCAMGGLFCGGQNWTRVE
jgi:hypothetical protein